MRLLPGFKEWLVKEEPRVSTSHHASGWSRCLRQQFYQWLNVAKSNPASACGQLKMRFGNVAEIIFAEYLKTLTGFEIIPQQEYRKEIPGLKNPISGRLDWTLKTDKEIYGLELKSTYGRGVLEIERSGPKPDYLKQIVVYAYLTGISKWIHPYIGRDNGLMTEFLVEISGDKVYSNGKLVMTCGINEVIGRLKTLEEYVEAKKLPPRDYYAAVKEGEVREKFIKDKVEYKTDWQCGYCDWKDYCWRDVVASCQIGDNSEMKR